MNHEPVYRTAPATPGLLNTMNPIRPCGSPPTIGMHEKSEKIVNLNNICEHKNGTYKLKRQLTENIPNWEYYLQLGISNPQSGIIYPIGDLGFLSKTNLVRAESKNQSTIPNWLKYHQLGI